MIEKKEYYNWKKEIILHKKDLLLAIIFLIFSLIIQTLSNRYVDKIHTVPVPDLLLDILPIVDLTFIFIFGMILVVTIFFLYPIIYTPKELYYVIGMISLFNIIRSIFISLTHLSAPIGAVLVSQDSIFSYLFSTNDVFFSGHAGLPFLGYLIFKNKKIKYFMLVSSILMAITVLLMHVHYSIDVASAYFITYGIYKIGNIIFEKEPKETK